MGVREAAKEFLAAIDAKDMERLHNAAILSHPERGGRRWIDGFRVGYPAMIEAAQGNERG